MPSTCRQLAAGLLLLFPPFSMLDLAAQSIPPVVVEHVTAETVKTGQRAIGTVHPLKRSTIGSAVDGRVKTFEVNQGQRVKKGQTLARIRTETLLIEKAAAVAERDLAKARLSELENGSRAEDIAEAKANYLGAMAAYQVAESNLKRITALSATNATSEQELDAATQRAESGKFALEASRSLFERMQNGPRREAIAQAKAQLELQQQRLNLIKDRITKFEINAPFDGFIAAEFTEEGAWIKQGDPVVELIQMNEVEIQSPVTAEVAVHLKKGTVLRVEFPELPDKLLTGKIKRVVPVTDNRARTFPVHIQLTNEIVDDSPLLLAGMLARVDFPAGRQENLPLVPKDALVLNGSQRYVFVVDSKNGTSTVRRVDVELGVALDDRIQVRGDLKVGEPVVIVGNERLTPGTEVRIIKRSDAIDLKSANSK